jgi:hypothetical protein
MVFQFLKVAMILLRAVQMLFPSKYLSQYSNSESLRAESTDLTLDYHSTCLGGLGKKLHLEVLV